jgi:hypothetical protein
MPLQMMAWEKWGRGAGALSVNTLVRVGIIELLGEGWIVIGMVEGVVVL